jgi:predicted  nucleic acid-binding Zn-ribbon protein
MQLKIEREALKKETDQASKDRLAALEDELANLEQQSSELTAKWQAEKDKIAGEQAQGGAGRRAARTGAGAAFGRLSPRAGELPMAASPT